MTWTHRDRFDALVAGERADRAAFAAWRHFREEEHSAARLAEATQQFVTEWEFDWVKLNPRATYYSEVWGNEFDTDDYFERDIPRQVSTAVQTPADLGRITSREAMTSPVLMQQLELSRLVRAALPELPLLQTVFSPLSILLQLSGISYYSGMPVFGYTPGLTLAELVSNYRRGMLNALQAITDTMSEYVQELLRNGVDGVFYAVTGTANTGLLDREKFDEFSRPFDIQLMDVAAGSPTILHTCGSASHPEYFTDYPASALSWDSFADDNPPLDAFDGTVVIGGVDHRLFDAEHADTVGQQARNALATNRDRPFILTPTCSIRSSIISDDALGAFRDSVV